MAKVAKTFKLEPEQWAILSGMAEARGDSMAGSLAFLLEQYQEQYSKQYSEPQEQYSNEYGSNTEGNTPGASGNTRSNTEAIPEELQQIIETLRKQLEVKDQQIADYSANLRDAHESLKAAQTLHAADTMPELVGSTESGKRTLKDRWRAFWA